jgi:hypothetical protein
MVVANNKIDGDKKYMSNAGNFDGHADAAVRCVVHFPMDRIHGLLDAAIGRVPIAPAAAMVDDFE